MAAHRELTEVMMCVLWLSIGRNENASGDDYFHLSSHLKYSVFEDRDE